MRNVEVVVTGFTGDVDVRNACTRVAAETIAVVGVAAFPIHHTLEEPARYAVAYKGEKGFGLVATANISKGEIIMEERVMRVMKKNDKPVEAANPHDRVWYDNNNAYLDIHLGRPGGWYFMNHCKDKDDKGQVLATTRIAILKDKQDKNVGVKVEAKTAIVAGEDLTVDYGEPDPSWAPCSPREPVVDERMKRRRRRAV